MCVIFTTTCSKYNRRAFFGLFESHTYPGGTFEKSVLFHLPAGNDICMGDSVKTANFYVLHYFVCTGRLKLFLYPYNIHKHILLHY